MITLGKFWTRVDRRDKNGCWPWVMCRRPKGYGAIRVDGRVHTAHRLAYELTHGVTLPPPILVCHRCDNPPCCNPDHLFIGTNDDNYDDAVSKGRAVVLRGEKHHLAKLAEDDVRAIRNSHDTQTVLAARFGVSQMNISLIRRRKIWKRVE